MKLGDVLDGKYRLVRQIRSGGMGSVYVADRIALGDTVAIKIILPEQNTETTRARFLREAQAAARIRHPNVVQIFDFGSSDAERPYIVMEYLDGPTLDDELQRHHRFASPRAITLFRSVCAAVEAGHRRGILHRDLKPGNVMLPRMDDGTEVVKVLDFGLARFTGETESMQLTSPGALLGTYAYMSPEQVLSERLGPPSDVFSLGTLLYEMVTGRLPFHAPSSYTLMDRIVSCKYTAPETIIPDVHPSISKAIAAALVRDPEARPASPESLMAIVDEVASAPSTVPRENSGDAAPFAAAVAPPRDRAPATIMVDATTADDRHQTIAGVGPPSNSPISGARRHPPRPSRTSDRPDLSCFVGRDVQLEAIRAEYDADTPGESRVVVLVGEPGIGKSTVARAFGDRVRDEGALVLSARFFDYEGTRQAPFEPILDMLASPRNSVDRRSTLSAEERIAAILGSTTARAEGGIPDESEKWRAFAAIAEELARLAEGRRLVLVFDDLQWAGRLHLELIGYLKRTLADRRIFILGTARDAETQRHSGSDLATWLLGQGALRSCAVVPVTSFTGESVRAWMTAVFGRIRIRALDVQRLTEATGGNPYYLSEIVRQLVGAGTIRRGADSWECAGLDRVFLPETISNAVRAKLLTLDEGIRPILETAAVIGDQFRFDTLRAATGLEDETLEAVIDIGLRQQVISEDGVSRPDDYRFFTKIIRRVLYDDLTARQRRKLHERVVGALERVHAGHLDRIAGALCYHYHAVGRWAETLRWGLDAGEAAMLRSDIDAAEKSLLHAKEAIENLRSDNASVDASAAMRIDLLRGTMLARLGRPEEAKALLHSAVDAAARSKARAVHADALLEYAQCFLARGDLEKGMAIAEESAVVAGAAGDRARAIAARIIAGNVLRRLGRTTEAEERFEAILGMLSDRDPLSLQSLAYQNMAWIRASRGAFEEGAEMAGRALDLADGARDPIAQQQAYSTLAMVRDKLGDYEASLRLQENSLRLSRALSMRRREGIDLANMGEALYFLERFEEALAYFEDGLAIFIEIGDRACEGDCRVNVGRAMLACQRDDEALAMLDRGRSICEETGRREYSALGLYYTAEAYLRKKEYSAASRAFERSQKIYVELELHDSWRPELGLARVALASGDRETARKHLDAAASSVERARAALRPSDDSVRFAEEVADVARLRAELDGA